VGAQEFLSIRQQHKTFMIERYTRPAMGRIWTEENKLAKWLEVELLACEALAERGEIPRDAVIRLRQHARACKNSRRKPSMMS
jgi:adenylosuccinate lyase